MPYGAIIGSERLLILAHGFSDTADTAYCSVLDAVHMECMYVKPMPFLPQPV